MNTSYMFKLLKEIDWRLILIVSCIFIFGLIMLTTATDAYLTGDYGEIIKQITGFSLGVGAIILIICIDYNTLGEHYIKFYVFTMILLILVWIPGLGVAQEGARRWIKFGPLYFQTSELAKLTFIISYAKIVEQQKDKLNTVKEIVPVVLKAAPILGLMLIQPDLGGTIVFGCVMLGMLFTAGLSTKIIKRVVIATVLALPLIYMLLAPHQRVRIDAFLNPGDLSYAGNYQVVQSMTAIGSGGIVGKGLYQGTQNQEGFLPVADSDFIFAVIGEELGLIGMAFIILLFLLFILRMVKMASEARDFYGTLVIIGVMSMFLYQIVQNIGMTVALIPVTGVTLPFVSYGASSIVASVASIGLVLNVGMRKKKINF